MVGRVDVCTKGKACGVIAGWECVEVDGKSVV